MGTKNPTIIVIDPAFSSTEFTTACVYVIDNGELKRVRTCKANHMNLQSQSDLVKSLHDFYEGIMVVEVTGLGRALFEQLQRRFGENNVKAAHFNDAEKLDALSLLQITLENK